MDSPTPSKKLRIAGWVLTGLLTALLIGLSATGKFIDYPGKEEQFQRMGFTIEQMVKIGVLEIIFTLLFIIPRSSFIGAILLTAYMGGATVTHLRVNEAFVFQIVIGVLIWVALGLRQPEVFRLAFRSQG